MLCLTRQRGQRIIIGSGADAITLEVVEIRGDKVRLGVTCPRHVPIWRGEIAEAKAAAAQPTEAPRA